MRKNSLARQARRAYDQGELARICTLREDRFGRAFGMQTVRVEPRWKSFRSDQSEDYYHFRDNNSSVLAVAHLDTVVSQKGRVPHFRSTERGPLITSGALDDRLGAYVILNLLPKLGVTCDWLLTVGEESGASTAEHFSPGGKKYDWAIEFDRGGTDVVMYQYEDDASMRLIEAAGAETGWGSFSDIAFLDQLGVKAFNWGVGYRGNYHSKAGYAYLNDTFAMVAKYLRFHEQNAGTRLPHDPDAGRYGSRSYGYYGKQHDDYYADCDVCMTRESVDSVTGYCLYCNACADCGQIENEGCMCFVPSHVRDEVTQAGSRIVSVTPARDWREMTWDEYCALRPGRRSALYDDVLCAECSRHVARCECDYDENPGSQPVKVPADAECFNCGKNLVDECTCELGKAHEDAQRIDGPGPLISAAPPWSEHRPDVSHGLGVPVSQKSSRIRAGEARSAVNPPAVFPDADLGWHAAAMNGDLNIVAHTPGQNWARVCLRCAARWPHPIAGSADIHPESDCPGCHRCDLVRLGRVSTGAIHVIPAHLAGESDACELCQAEVHQAKATISRLDR